MFVLSKGACVLGVPLVAVALLAAPAAAVAADPTWIGGSGNWSDAKNWKGGTLPVETDTVRISNTVGRITVNIDLPSVKMKALRFEGHSVTADVTVTGGKIILTSSDWSMKSSTDWTGNCKRWDLSSAALVAYPNGVDFHVPVEFTSSGKVGMMATFRDLHFRKSVTAPNATTFYFHNGSCGDYFGYVPKVTDYESMIYFHGDFRAPKANLTPHQAPTRHLYFYGPSFEADKLQFGDYCGTYCRLMSTNTIIHSGIISPAFWGCFESEAPGTYPTNTVVYFRKNASTDGDFKSSVDLGCVDRTFDRLTSDALAASSTSVNGYEIRSKGHNQQSLGCYCRAPTTLTLRGTESAGTEGRVMDDVTVVWDPVGDYTQAFSNRTHTTVGSFIVKGGTMMLAGAGSFKSARSLEIAAGATFVLDSSLDNPLPRDLVVTSTSMLRLNGVSVTVKRLIVDGVAQADGTYAGEAWMDGAGSVTVAAGSCCTWTNTAGGVWSDAANWLNGTVPSSTSSIAILDAETAEDITITIGSDIAAANFPGQLEILNRGAGTTTLSVANSVTDNDGRVRVGRHARVEVPTGGLFYYETTSGRASSSKTWHATPCFSIVDGGVWKTCGGTTTVTNFCGECWVTGEGSKLEITAGVHLHSSWSSDYAILVGAGARVEQTGGAFLQPHDGYNNAGELTMWGGTIDLSAGTYDSTKVPPEKTSSQYGHANGCDFGFGTLTLRGTVDAKLGDPVQFMALFPGTHAHWNVRDGINFYSRSYRIGGRNQIDATLHVYETPKIMGGAGDACGNYLLGSVYNGSSSGDGRLHIHSGGFLRAGVLGVWAAGGDNNVAYNPTCQKGLVRVDAGGALLVEASTRYGYSAAIGPNGIRVGGCARTTCKSGRPYQGRMEVAGQVTNRINLVIGGWYGQGVYVQEGGETLTATSTDALERGVTALGMAGGSGTLLVSNGLFSAKQNVWVGGCLTNSFIVRDNGTYTLVPNRYVEYGCPESNHGAEGLLELSGGQFAAAKDLYVGSDGTGVVSVVGSTGTFSVGEDLVLSNQTASILRFTADEKGVAPIAIGGKLVLTDASALEVDLSACPNVSRAKLFTAKGGVTGDFATMTVAPVQYRLVRRGNSLYALNRRGVVICIQ